MITHPRHRRTRVQHPAIGRERLERLLDGIEQSSGTIAAAITGINEQILSELREDDARFEHRIKKAVCHSLEQKSFLLAYEGVLEPVVANGNILRDDDGNPIAVRRYSGSLLLALLRAENPERFALPTFTIHAPWVRWLAWASLAVVAMWVMGDLGLRVFALMTGR